MIDLEEYNRIRKEVDRVQRDVSRAEGALAETANQVKEEFGCSTLVEAKELVGRLTKEADDAEAKYKKAVKAFWRKWPEEY